MDDKPQKSFLPAEILRKAGALGLYQLAVWALSITVVLVTVGIITLAFAGIEAPAALASLGTTALVGLVAMLRAGEGSTSGG